MAAEDPTPAGAELEAAWSQVTAARVDPAQLGSFTRRRVERIIGVVVAVGCIALGGQAFLIALGGRGEAPGWHPALELIVFIPLGAMLLSLLVGRAARTLSGVFAVVYAISLILWPTAAAGVPTAPGTEPWIFYLINVGTVAAVLAFPLTWQIVFSAGLPLLWGAVRAVQSGMDPGFTLSIALDVSFALIFGGILVTLGWVFRTVAANVDAARARTVASYAAVAAAEATEKERVSVGALMHDSVLAALIAVERAHSPRERTLAVGMAREALTRLANTDRDAGMGPEAPESVEAVARQIETGAADLGVRVRVERRHVAAETVVPGVVARALALASAQAIANALEHAGGRGLAVSVTATDRPVHVVVRVRDAGPGFDPDEVDADRLGITASIVARMAAVGGRARLRSDASGTVVTMEWAGSA